MGGNEGGKMFTLNARMIAYILALSVASFLGLMQG
jgi:hypothetical protein